MYYIGTAGCPERFYAAGGKSSTELPAWLREQGLNLFEYQCGKGVRVSEAFAERLREAAARHRIRLTLHAPYYINLATAEPDKKQKTRQYILESLAAARLLGSDRVVVHPGSAKPSRDGALARACRLLREILAEADAQGLLDGITLCPELMGKRNQLGDLDEVLALCRVDERLVPCVDFGHLNARTSGGLKSPADYEAVCRRIGDALGLERLRTMHVHFSRIEFGRAGEIRHLTFDDHLYGPDFRDFAPVIRRLKLEPVMVCESAGTQDVDALAMKAILTEHQCRPVCRAAD